MSKELIRQYLKLHIFKNAYVLIEIWEYKLGNRSALEWILDQYKEKKPRDETIRTKLNTYKFADYKSEVIELLQKVTTVSVKTMEIVREMEKVGVGDNYS